eukprot:m.310693 g.310693  ORF g.310693 m.310693 type:complete len:319 (-) comp16478_c0_seq29:86-1042(-)
MVRISTQLQGDCETLCLATDVQGRRILSGSEDGAKLWCLNSNKSTLTLGGLTEEVCALSISPKHPDKVFVAEGSNLHIYDLHNPSESLITLEPCEDDINELAVSENGRFLAACDDSGMVKIYEIEKECTYKSLRRGHTSICSSIKFRPRKPWEIISGGLDCMLDHWDFSRGRVVSKLNMNEVLEDSVSGGAQLFNPPLVHHVAISPDGRKVAGALGNGSVSMFNFSSTKKEKLLYGDYLLNGHSSSVSQVMFLTKTLLVSGGNDKRVCLWDITDSNANSNQPNQHITLDGKINWVGSISDRVIAVADTSVNISILDIV